MRLNVHGVSCLRPGERKSTKFFIEADVDCSNARRTLRAQNAAAAADQENTPTMQLDTSTIGANSSNENGA